MLKAKCDIHRSKATNCALVRRGELIHPRSRKLAADHESGSPQFSATPCDTPIGPPGDPGFVTTPVCRFIRELVKGNPEY